MVVLVNISSNTTESKLSVNNIVNNVFKIVTKVSKTQDFDTENLTQTIDSIHACDDPYREDDVDKMLYENPISENVSVYVVDTFIYGILRDYHKDMKDSSDEDPLATQVVDENDVVDNNVNIPSLENEKI